jgi:hypothetical protein
VPKNLHFGLVRHALAGQRAFDKNHLARLAVLVDGAADAARVHVERIDFDGGRDERGIGGDVSGRRGTAAMRFSSGFRHLRTS